MTRRAAIIQTDGVHEEIISSLIHALGAGWEVAVYINQRCRDTRGDIFAQMPEVSAKIYYVAIENRPDWEALQNTIRAFAPDLVISSTFQRDGAAAFMDSFGVPVLGVVHNVAMARAAPFVSEMLDTGRAQALVLAPHVAAALNRATDGTMMDRIGVIEPVYWGADLAQANDKRRIAVPGGVNAANRDFPSLINALSDPTRARAMADAGVVIEVLGGGPDRATIADEVAKRGLDPLITFAPLGPNGRVHYDAYFKALRQSWAILPLIPLEKADYRLFKITSAVPTSVGFGLPIVLDRWTASVYRNPALPAAGPVAASLDALCDMDSAHHGALTHDIRVYRDAALTRNRDEMARMVAPLARPEG